MFISIIIPVYNVEKFIKRCLVGFLSIDKFCSSFELVVVNDGSKDKSMEIAKDVLFNFSHVTYVDKENGGLSSARNAGLKVAKGKYIWFFDSDDWLNLEGFEKALECLKKYMPDVLQIDFLLAYDDGTMKQKYHPTLSGFVPRNAALKDSQTSVGAPFSIFKHSFLNQYHLAFKEGIYHEDVEFKPRALFYASSIYYLHEVCYYYYQRSSGSITSHLTLKHAQDSLTIAKSLMQFIQHNQMVMADRIIFYNKISAALVYMLRVAKSLNDDIEVTQILQLLSKNKGLVSKMLLSFNLKYTLLGILLLISPKMLYTLTPKKY